MTGPFDHPWLGGLFHDGQAALIWSAERQLAHMLAFEAAWSRALGATGLAEPGAAEAAARAIEAARPDIAGLRDGTGLDGLPVPALVRQLRAAAGENANAVHTGSTSQDVMDTALALTLKSFSDLLDTRLRALEQELSDLTALHGNVPLMGRTRMQAALPIRVADRLDTWRLPLSAHLDRLDALRPRVELVQVGGAAGDRAALGDKADAATAHMAKALGLGVPPRAWHAMRDGLADYAGLLSLITGTLGKIGQDICLMAQQGADEIALKGGGGSSAMPHKQNPILAELLVTLARFNATQLSGMHHALVHEQERSGAAWTLEWMLLPQMAHATARALSAASEVMAGVERIGASR